MFFILLLLSLSLSLSSYLPPQEHYLPFVLSSKLKLWCNDGSDRGLASFLDTSLQDETSRSVLELHYPEELTLSYILRDDYDRAYYYLNLSLQAAQQVSALYASSIMHSMHFIIMLHCNDTF